MSSFSAIELAKLPAPDVVEKLDFETILTEMKADLSDRDEALKNALQLESEPLIKLLEVCAYRELLLRQRINDASRSVMLAYAKGTDLDNLAALFGVERYKNPGDPNAQPPIEPTEEDDSRLRRRVQLSLEGHSTAGPRGSYMYWALSSSPNVKDVDVKSPSPGEVLVTILSTIENGEPDAELLELVEKSLNSSEVRPLTDRVTVEAASITNYKIEAQLSTFQGPDAEVVRKTALQAVVNWVSESHQLGRDITLSGLYAALHQPGVKRVVLTEPPEDINVTSNQAAFCSPEDIVVTMEVGNG